MIKPIVAFIKLCNQNIFFKWVSSVRLAVPLMLGLIVSFVAGTLFESWHNAEYAKLAVYNTGWFNFMIFLLALNILCSMLSRIPWKRHHLGFVITHIGILILLLGSALTKINGIDGSLELTEGSSSSRVFLPDLSFGYYVEGIDQEHSIDLPKSIFEKSGSSLGFANDTLGHIVEVERFVPFAEVVQSYGESSSAEGSLVGAIGLSFKLQSPFFNVSEWLDSSDRPEMKMGPATLTLIEGEPPSNQRSLEKNDKGHRVTQTESKFSHPKSSNLGLFRIKKGGKIQKELPIQPNLTFELEGYQVKIKTIYTSAVVDNNKIAENKESGQQNPALELEIIKGEKKWREVVFEKFPGFSINKEKIWDFEFEMESQFSSLTSSLSTNDDSQGSLPSGHPPIEDSSRAASGVSSGPMSGGNQFRFYVNRSDLSQVRLILAKNGKTVTDRPIAVGEEFVTPWMGMKITILSLKNGVKKNIEVTAISPPPGKNLPPSALLIKPKGATQSTWLLQNEVKSFDVEGKKVSFFFGNKSIMLPFELKLDQFIKRDYPGTQTPMSYESHVTNLLDQSTAKISMNEPMNHSGYTLYQASFQMNPGAPPISILSVNKDPGRFLKYMGSVILALGVVIFTFMNRGRGKSHRKGDRNEKI